MDILIYSSSIQNVQKPNQSIRIQTLKTNQRSNSFHFTNLNVIIKQLNKTHTRRKSCYCTECGSLGRFQFQNMNTRLIQQNMKITEICNNTKNALTLTLPKQEIFFQRKRTVKKTDKKTTIIDSSTTGDKIDEQKTQYFNFNMQSRSSILSNMIQKRELQIKQINKISKPQCLIQMQQKMKSLIPITQKHIQLSFPHQNCSSRIKTENLSYHYYPTSPENRITTTKSNYKNSPYYYTYRQFLTPKIIIRNEQKIRKQSINQ